MSSSSSSSSSTLTSPYVLTPLVILTTILALAAGVYLSGHGDDVAKYFASRFFKAKAEAEKTALRHAGGEKGKAFLCVFFK